MEYAARLGPNWVAFHGSNILYKLFEITNAIADVVIQLTCCVARRRDAGPGGRIFFSQGLHISVSAHRGTAEKDFD